MYFELLFDPVLVITIAFKAFCLYTCSMIQTVQWVIVLPVFHVTSLES